MDAAAAYMAWMERLYVFELVVAMDDGNGGGGRGGARLCIPAGIPGILRNPQEPGLQKKGTTFLFRRNL